MKLENIRLGIRLVVTSVGDALKQVSLSVGGILALAYVALAGILAFVAVVLIGVIIVLAWPIEWLLQPAKPMAGEDPYPSG